MKNIHILPTDKPSRLHNKNGELGNYPSTKLYIEYFKGNQHNSFHIYITSDEEIKEGDWNLPPSNIPVKHQGQKFKGDEPLKCWKKIILTTDQDLIKDGVQAIEDEFLEWFVNNPSYEEVEVKDVFKSSPIGFGNAFDYYKIIIPIDDEFLEWFVKNPSCEEVEVHLVPVNEFGSEITVNGYGFDKFKYKITISKEEPKPDYSKIREGLKKSIKGKEHFIQHFKNGGTVEDFKPLQEPKQETLEEAAKKLFGSLEKGIGADRRNIWMSGAKWQAERMYSEEEVMSILINSLHSVEIKDQKNYSKIYNGMKEWFEQNKKK